MGVVEARQAPVQEVKLNAQLELADVRPVGGVQGDLLRCRPNVFYSNHLEQARLQLSRAPRALPTMTINPGVKDLFAFKYEDFTLHNYDPHPHIKAEVAV